MKGVIAFALFATAAAVAAPAPAANNICNIPSKYVSSLGLTCQGANAGYTVFGACVSPFSPSAADIAIAPQVVVQLTNATAPAFSLTTTAAGAATFAGFGCAAPSYLRPWRTETLVAGTTDASFVAPLTTSTGDCIFQMQTQQALFDATSGTFKTGGKSVGIFCDTANDFFPTAGLEGYLACLDSGTANYPFANAGSATAFFSLPFTPLNQFYPSWYNSSLTCARGCVLPATFCQGNVLTGNVIGNGVNFLTSTTTSCLVRPGATFQVACRTNLNQVFTGTCAANSNALVNGNVTFLSNGVAATPDCGLGFFNGVNGAAVQNGAITGFYTRINLRSTTQGLNTIPGFPGVTSSVAVIATIAGTANSGAQFGLDRQRVYVPFAAGSQYRVIAVGCPVGASGADCTQAVINYWRCQGLLIDSATFCFFDGVTVVACPTPTLGFNCNNNDDGSKKGLLGLLGLLGIIPLALCLLLSSLLLCCFCRKTKKEGDVHFATFDPHAAPIAAPLGGTIAPGTACYAPSIGGPALY